MTNAFGIATDPLRAYAHGSPQLRGVIKESLRMSLGALVSSARPRRVVSRLCEILVDDALTEADVIEACRGVIAEAAAAEGVRAAVRASLSERATRILGQVRPHVLSGSVLDWGCGDALVAEGLSNDHEIHLVDVEDHRAEMADADLLIFDEAGDCRALDLSCPTVLLLTVLHHAKDPGGTLCAALSGRPRRVVVIESTPELQHESFNGRPASEVFHVRYEYCGFVDWWYNRVICEDVQCPHNYLPAASWRQLFAVAGYHCVHDEALGVDIPLVPEWHHLMVFEPN